MKLSIHITTEQRGRPHRGYHDFHAEIRFEYHEGLRTRENEISIIDRIFQKDSPMHMWYRYIDDTGPVYFLNYGWDSGD